MVSEGGQGGGGGSFSLERKNQRISMKKNIEVLITIENQRMSMRNLGLEFLDCERESENEYEKSLS